MLDWLWCGQIKLHRGFGYSTACRLQLTCLYEAKIILQSKATACWAAGPNQKLVSFSNLQPFLNQNLASRQLNLIGNLSWICSANSWFILTGISFFILLEISGDSINSSSKFVFCPPPALQLDSPSTRSQMNFVRRNNWRYKTKHNFDSLTKSFFKVTFLRHNTSPICPHSHDLSQIKSQEAITCSNLPRAPWKGQ